MISLGRRLWNTANMSVSFLIGRRFSASEWKPKKFNTKLVTSNRNAKLGGIIMKTQTEKLNVRDFVTIAILTVVELAVYFVIGMPLGSTPLSWIFCLGIQALPLGIVFMVNLPRPLQVILLTKVFLRRAAKRCGGPRWWKVFLPMKSIRAMHFCRRNSQWIS